MDAALTGEFANINRKLDELLARPYLTREQQNERLIADLARRIAELEADVPCYKHTIEMLQRKLAKK